MNNNKINRTKIQLPKTVQLYPAQDVYAVLFKSTATLAVIFFLFMIRLLVLLM